MFTLSKSTVKKEKNIKLNYLFSVTYRIFAIIIPIVSTPYLTSILGAEGIGQQSYVSSYATYFLLFGLLGFGIYGQRLISNKRDDPYQMSKSFWELYSSQVLISLLALLSFVFLAVFQPFGSQYQLCFYVEIINVASAIFNINYFLEGNEEFGKIAIRDIIVKIASLICIFVFVKKSDQVWIYALILSVSTIVSNLLMWPYLLKHLTKVRFREIKFFRHTFPCFMLFLPTIAAKIYPLIDRTLIGLITKSDIEVGNYSKAQQIVDSCTLLLTALGVVVSPRNAYLYSSGKKDEFLANVYKAFKFVLFLGPPMMIGIICVARNLVPWYLNDSAFSSAIGIMMILSITIILCGIRNIYGIQYLVSSGQDKKYVISIIIGTIINVCLSIPLIFLIGNYGAAIASVISEAIICLIMFFFSKKDIKIKTIFKGTWKFFVSTLALLLICFPMGIALEPSIKNTCLIIIAGMIVYFIFLVSLKDKTLFDFINEIKGKFSFIERIYSRKKTIDILVYAFYILVCITALSYSPIFRKIHLNNFVFVLWILYTLLILPISFNKLILLSPYLLFFLFPAFLYLSCVSAFLSKTLLTDDLTKEIIVATYIFAIGYMSTSFLQEKHIKSVLNYFFFANIFMAVDLFVEYFIGFDFSEITYVYAEKNGIAPLFVIAALVPFLYPPRNKIYFGIEIIGSIFLLVMIAMLKCRAVLVVIPILAIFLSFNPKYKPFVPYVVLGITAFSLIVVFLVPQLRTLIIENILFANRSSGSIDDIASGRITYVTTGLKLFALSPVTGIGSYYIDLAPAEILVSYGVVGFLLTIPSFSAPIVTYCFAKKKLGNESRMFFVSMLIIFYSNSLFEAYSPYGPGVRAFMLWFFAGFVLDKSFKNEVCSSKVVYQEEASNQTFTEITI